MRIHMLGPYSPSVLMCAGKGGSRLTPELMNPPAVRGPRVPHPAAGLRLGGYATQLEDLSACYLNQEDPFE